MIMSSISLHLSLSHPNFAVLGFRCSRLGGVKIIDNVVIGVDNLITLYTPIHNYIIYHYLPQFTIIIFTPITTFLLPQHYLPQFTIIIFTPITTFLTPTLPTPIHNHFSPNYKHSLTLTISTSIPNHYFYPNYHIPLTPITSIIFTPITNILPQLPHSPYPNIIYPNYHIINS